jgi:hypothetical protein
MMVLVPRKERPIPEPSKNFGENNLNILKPESLSIIPGSLTAIPSDKISRSQVEAPKLVDTSIMLLEELELQRADVIEKLSPHKNIVASNPETLDNQIFEHDLSKETTVPNPEDKKNSRKHSLSEKRDNSKQHSNENKSKL